MPRPGDGYDGEDNSGALVVVCREPRPAPNANGLSRLYLDFVLASVQPDGRCHTKMGADQLWADVAGVGQGWGRALWALGVAATSAENSALQSRALAGFQLAAKQRSTELRALAFAGVGAAELLRRFPGNATATALLGDAAEALLWDETGADWHWPEPRLAHVNAILAEALLSAGEVLENDEMYARGLEMLQFLLDVETHAGHLSITPVGGRGPGDGHPAGLQSPVDVAALADACATAFRITREQRWRNGVELAWLWFCGENDASSPMFDPATGGAFDSLGPDGASSDQGAAATVAMLSTAQHARRLLGRAQRR